MVHTRSLGLLGALLLGALAPAQQETGQQPAESPAKTEYKELSDAYTKAAREYSTKLRAEMEAAKKEGKPAPAISMTGPAAEWMPKFQAGADKYKGTDGAVPYLIWIAGQSRDAARDEVMATLLHDHAKSPEIAGALRLITSQMSGLRAVRMVDGKRVVEDATPEKKAAVEKTVRDQLSMIAKENPSPDVQAQALLARANLVLEARDEVDASKKPAAIADVRLAMEVAKDPKLKTQMEGILYEQDHLQPGMTSPEITGKDLDGVDFKLSDYRGKVVLLDFWGYW